MIDAIEQAIKDGTIKPSATKVFSLYKSFNGSREIKHHFISAKEFWQWFQGLNTPSEYIIEWVLAWCDENTVMSGKEAAYDPEDAYLGRKTRDTMAKMGRLRHAENAARSQWWEPYIAEAKELMEKEGKKKIEAARIVSKRHPEAKINPDTLRQKWKNPLQD